MVTSLISCTHFQTAQLPKMNVLIHWKLMSDTLHCLESSPTTDLYKTSKLQKTKWSVVQREIVHKCWSQSSLRHISLPNPWFLRSKEPPVAVADATFTYKIPKDGKHFFTKKGPKRLEVARTTGTQVPKFSQQLIFKSEKKWEIDQFQPGHRNDEEQSSNKYHLQLTLRPNTLNHKDDWTVVSYSNDAEDVFLVQTLPLRVMEG